MRIPFSSPAPRIAASEAEGYSAMGLPRNAKADRGCFLVVVLVVVLVLVVRVLVLLVVLLALLLALLLLWCMERFVIVVIVSKSE